MVKGSKKLRPAVEKTDDVCRFFLNGGRCRFGDKCRNRHVIEDLSTEGADPEVLQNIGQYLANYGLIQTEATKFNSALKEIQDLEKKNKEMEDKIKKIEMEIDESKGRILCRICLDHKDLSKFFSFKCGHCYCYACIRNMMSHNLPAINVHSNITCPTCALVCKRSDLRKLY